jgi:hypothetical protein
MNVTSSPLDIYAVVSATKNFDRFRLQYGVGNNPSKWVTLMTSDDEVNQPEKLITWDVYEADAARITLRIYVYSTRDTFAEKRIHINLDVPTQTPTVTPTITQTPEPTSTPVPTETPIPTVTVPVMPTDTPAP